MIWSTVVVIVLALMVLLFLVLFFTSTPGSFLGKVKTYFTYSNVDVVVDGCNILSSTEGSYSFCCEKKTVKYYLNGEKVSGDFSCGDLIEKSFINNQINGLNCGEISC